MFSGYHEKFQRTVTATKALNDTAVEYISGIEVIKAFGQSKTSYSHITDEMRQKAAAKIDMGIAKAEPQLTEESTPQERTMTTFQARKRWSRKVG